MNGGEVVVCDECDRPFEVERDWIGEDVTCPYCAEKLKSH